MVTLCSVPNNPSLLHRSHRKGDQDDDDANDDADDEDDDQMMTKILRMTK